MKETNELTQQNKKYVFLLEKNRFTKYLIENVNKTAKQIAYKLLEEYFDLEDDDFSKDLLHEGNIDGCIDMIEHCCSYSSEIVNDYEVIRHLKNCMDYDEFVNCCKDLNRLFINQNKDLKLQILDETLNYNELEYQYYKLFNCLPPYFVGVHQHHPIYMSFIKECIDNKKKLDWYEVELIRKN